MCVVWSGSGMVCSVSSMVSLVSRLVVGCCFQCQRMIPSLQEEEAVR